MTQISENEKERAYIDSKDFTEPPTSKQANKGEWVAKTFFLTYARCEMEMETLKLFLSNKLAVEMIQGIICKEMHKDGYPHLHAWFKLEKAIHVSNDFFDCECDTEMQQENGGLSYSFLF